MSTPSPRAAPEADPNFQRGLVEWRIAYKQELIHGYRADLQRSMDGQQRLQWWERLLHGNPSDCQQKSLNELIDKLVAEKQQLEVQLAACLVAGTRMPEAQPTPLLPLHAAHTSTPQPAAAAAAAPTPAAQTSSVSLLPAMLTPSARAPRVYTPEQQRKLVQLDIKFKQLTINAFSNELQHSKDQLRRLMWWELLLDGGSYIHDQEELEQIIKQEVEMRRQMEEELAALDALTAAAAEPQRDAAPGRHSTALDATAASVAAQRSLEEPEDESEAEDVSLLHRRNVATNYRQVACIV